MKKIAIRTFMICACLLSCKKNSSTSTDKDELQPALKWVKVYTSASVSMALSEDGSLWSWGDNRQGLAGIGSLPMSNKPIKIFDSGIKAFRLFEVIKTDGTLYRTGWNSGLQVTYGDCAPFPGLIIYYNHGSSAIPDLYSYQQFGSDANWKDFSIKTDHSIWAMGPNNYTGFFNWTSGCKGWYSSPNYFPTYTKINQDTDWKEIASAPNDIAAILGIKNDGTLWQLGTRERRQNSQPNPGIPIQIGIDKDWDRFSTSDATGRLVFKQDGTVFSLELSTTALNTYNPIQFGTEKWKSVTSGFFLNGSGTTTASFVGIKADGTLWAYGKNTDGFIGSGTTTNLSSLTKISTKTDWVQISGEGFDQGYSNRSFLLIDSAGDIWGWGKNDKGQLGDGTNTDKYVPTLLIKNRTL